MSDEQLHHAGMTLEKAEQFFRYVATNPIESDTDAAFCVFVAEYDRRPARITELEQCHE